MGVQSTLILSSQLVNCIEVLVWSQCHMKLSVFNRPVKSTESHTAYVRRRVTEVSFSMIGQYLVPDTNNQ